MDKKELKELLEIKGINVSDKMATDLDLYADYILKANQSINLTAIKDKDSFMEKMIFDSALPLLLFNPKDKKIIDVGTGAGFPGMVLSIVGDCDVDLLDSTGKKLNVIEGFGNSKVHTINNRVEEFVKNHRESYDVAIARAVAPLNILLELCLPLVKVGGHFIAMKALDAENEIKEAKNAIEKLGANIEKIDKQSLPNGEIRINILFVKNKETNKKYPRTFGDIKKKPL